MKRIRKDDFQKNVDYPNPRIFKSLKRHQKWIIKLLFKLIQDFHTISSLNIAAFSIMSCVYVRVSLAYEQLMSRTRVKKGLDSKIIQTIMTD